MMHQKNVPVFTGKCLSLIDLGVIKNLTDINDVNRYLYKTDISDPV